MTTILVVHTARGGTRRCDAACHDADPKGKCNCICGGTFHGIGGKRALQVPAERLEEVRQTMRLEEEEFVQLRVGA